jgi:hypothetical protein
MLAAAIYLVDKADDTWTDVGCTFSHNEYLQLYNALFSSREMLGSAIVLFSFLFNNYYLIIV